MKLKKRILSVLLIAFLIVTIIPTTTLTDYVRNSGGTD